MTASELRKSSLEELQSKLKDSEEENLRLRCNKIIQQLTNTSLLKKGRRNIAQIQTVINEKQNNN